MQFQITNFPSSCPLHSLTHSLRFVSFLSFRCLLCEVCFLVLLYGGVIFSSARFLLCFDVILFNKFNFRKHSPQRDDYFCSLQTVFANFVKWVREPRKKRRSKPKNPSKIVTQRSAEKIYKAKSLTYPTISLFYCAALEPTKLCIGGRRFAVFAFLSAFSG